MSKMLDWSDPQVIELIKHDGLFVAPTDTIAGLMGRISPEVFKKLNNAKERQQKPYLCLVADMQKAKELVSITPHYQALLAHCWPGPVTALLPKRAEVPVYIGSTQAIALRVPAHEGLQHLLKQVSGLFSTSANRAGHPAPILVSDVAPIVQQACDFMIDDAQGVGLPSTIIDCTGDEVRLIREGAVPFEQIKTWQKEIMEA